MSKIIIYLGISLPICSSDLPENSAGNLNVFCSVLLRMGFTRTHTVTSIAVVSYTTISSLPHKVAVSFLLHFPGSHLHWPLASILPYEARTFLTCVLSPIAAAIIHLTQLYTLSYFSSLFYSFSNIFRMLSIVFSSIGTSALFCSFAFCKIFSNFASRSFR